MKKRRNRICIKERENDQGKTEKAAQTQKDFKGGPDRADRPGTGGADRF